MIVQQNKQKPEVSDSFQDIVYEMMMKFDPMFMAMMLGSINTKPFERIAEKNVNPEKLTGKKVTEVKDAGKKVGNIDTAYYTSVSENETQKLRRGEGVANVSAKLLNFLKKVGEEKKINYELEKKFSEQRHEQEKKRHQKLIDSINNAKKVEFDEKDLIKEKNTDKLKTPSTQKTKQTKKSRRTKSTPFFSKVDTSTRAKVGIGAGVATLASFSPKSEKKETPSGDLSGGVGVGTGKMDITGKRKVQTQQERNSLPAIQPSEVYNYLVKSKNLSHNQAIGILTNIQAESAFKPAIIGDNGATGGLFQHNGKRYLALDSAVPNWETNWRGQIDFALSEQDGKNYLKKDYATPQEASKAFTFLFERPANTEFRAQERLSNISFIENKLKNTDTTKVADVPTSKPIVGEKVSSISTLNKDMKKQSQSTVVIVMDNSTTIVNSGGGKQETLQSPLSLDLPLMLAVD